MNFLPQSLLGVLLVPRGEADGQVVDWKVFLDSRSNLQLWVVSSVAQLHPSGLGGLHTFTPSFSPEYTMPFSTKYIQYMKALFRTKYATTAGPVYAFVASQPNL